MAGEKPLGRRIGAENSATRAAIIAATEALMRDDGYAAVSTRKVAAKGGFKPSLVHYYFPTTDDLMQAVHRKGAAESAAWLENALAAPRPLRALWSLFTDSSRNELAAETIALANHRKGLQAEIAADSERMRASVVCLLEKNYADILAKEGLTAAGFCLVLVGIGRALVTEGGLGIAGGHNDAKHWVDAWLQRLEP